MEYIPVRVSDIIRQVNRDIYLPAIQREFVWGTDRIERLFDSIMADFRANLGCLLGEYWTTPRLAEMVITPDGHLLGRCEGEASFRAFLGAPEDLLRNIRGVAPVAERDGDEIGYLVGRVGEIKRPAR